MSTSFILPLVSSNVSTSSIHKNVKNLNNYENIDNDLKLDPGKKISNKIQEQFSKAYLNNSELAQIHY